MFRRGEPGAGIAGDDPSGRRLVPEGLQIFRLPGQQADHAAAGEQSPLVAFPDQPGQVGAEGGVEHRVGFGRGQCLYRGSGLDPALRRPLFADEGDVRPFFGQQPLEPRHGRLPVFVVGRHRHPAFGGQCRRLVRQHRRLHVGAGTQTEGIAVALAPGQRVGQRLGGQERDPVVPGEVGDRQADMGKVGSGQQHHPFAGQQFAGHPHRVVWPATVVPGDHIQRSSAQQAAGGVDLGNRQLPALTIGQGEGGQTGVAVDLADADRVAVRGRCPGREGRQRRSRRKHQDRRKTGTKRQAKKFGHGGPSPSDNPGRGAAGSCPRTPKSYPLPS